MNKEIEAMISSGFWELRVDSETQQKYLYNPQSGEKQWVAEVEKHLKRKDHEEALDEKLEAISIEIQDSLNKQLSNLASSIYMRLDSCENRLILLEDQQTYLMNSCNVLGENLNQVQLKNQSLQMNQMKFKKRSQPQFGLLVSNNGVRPIFGLQHSHEKSIIPYKNSKPRSHPGSPITSNGEYVWSKKYKNKLSSSNGEYYGSVNEFPQLNQGLIDKQHLSKETERLCGLVLSRYQLNQLPRTVKSLQQIEFLSILDISGINLYFLDEEILKALPMVEELYVNKNRLEQLPDMACMPNIKKLYARNNQIQFLPDNFKSCDKLEKVFLEGNLICELPEIGSGELPNLREFHVCDNQLKNLPEVFTLDSLQEFKADHNQLSQIPLALANTPSLVTASFAHNSIVEVPDFAGQLKYLCLNHNLIEVLPTSLKDSIKSNNGTLLFFNQNIIKEQSTETPHAI